MKKLLKVLLGMLICSLMAFSIVACQITNPISSSIDGESQSAEGTSDSSADGSQSDEGSSDVEREYFLISTAPCENGTLEADKEEAREGETVTLTVTAEDGYFISNVTISYGDSLRYLTVKEDTATFKMPAGDTTVSAEFGYETREVVDYLILGDSYTDMSGWQDFYSDMRDLPSAKTIGVGGTTVPQWGKTGSVFGHSDEPTGGMDNQVARWDGKIIKTDVLGNYAVKNFVFHLGVNDLKSGVPSEIVISDLKILFEQYHKEYPNAHIYWISLSLNVSSPEYTDAYKAVNRAMAEYAEECEYLTYINTVDTMFPDGKPNADWFVDGLHFNQDGYATWSSLITEALGYPRQDVDVFGSADIYYSSNTWNYDPDTKTITNEIRGEYSEQSLWFDGVFDVDLYAEMEVCVNGAVNDDDWPKFGMSVNGNGNHAFFFVEATKNLTGKAVNYTERRPYANRYVVCESSTWDWNIQGKWIDVPSMSYTNGNFVKLGLLRCGADMYFLVNDEVVFTKGGFISCDDAMAIGLTLTNLNVTVKNYSVTTDVDGIIARYNINNAPDAHYEGVKDPTFTNQTQNGEVVKNLLNFSASKFYYETEITLNSVLTLPNSSETDKYPKAGICLQAGGNSLMFYIDAENNGNFGSSTTVGIVYRASGGNWNWQDKVQVTLPSLAYTNSSYAKLSVYKDGVRLVFMVNGVRVLETTEYSAFAGKASVGVIGFNLAFTARNAKIATSETILGLIDEKIGFIEK